MEHTIDAAVEHREADERALAAGRLRKDADDRLASAQAFTSGLDEQVRRFGVIAELIETGHHHHH